MQVMNSFNFATTTDNLATIKSQNETAMTEYEKKSQAFKDRQSSCIHFVNDKYRNLVLMPNGRIPNFEQKPAVDIYTKDLGVEVHI